MTIIKQGRLLAVLLLLCGLLSSGLWAQTQPFDPGCTPAGPGGKRPASAYIIYGGSNKMKNSTQRMKLTIGQMLVDQASADTINSWFGYWAGYLSAPGAPMVTATQGDLLDRIQISWSNNALGAFPTGGYKLYRDGVYLAAVDKNTRNYNDFNVIAGQPYHYQVRGINVYGEGPAGQALGFQVPNGVVTGWVRTQNDNPVPNALVALTPMQGTSAYFGQFDGASSEADTVTDGHFLPIDGVTAWTVTFWVKNQSVAGNPGILTLSDNNTAPVPLAFTPLGSGISATIGGGVVLSGNFTTEPNGWHHVALSFEDNQYRLYLDGTLMAQQTGPALINTPDLNLGARTGLGGAWQGRLDELRIYYRRLDDLDFAEVMEGTASSLTPGLKYYWKMDEGQGSKTFDVIRRDRMYFCGAIFGNDRPPVRTAGITNEEGYYRIESASYGTGTTFLAEPMKNFYRHRALKFVRSESDYATLPDFSLTSKATLEMWVNSAGPDGAQCLLSKKWMGGNSFQLGLEPAGLDNNIIVKINNSPQNFGMLGIGYHLLSLTIDSTAGGTNIALYKDGVLMGNGVMPPVTGNWSDTTEVWGLGALKSGNFFVDHFGGLIDEVAVYDTILSNATITGHFQNSRDPQEAGLRVYFSLDEGSGIRLNNSGSVLLDGSGTGYGTSWTAMSPHQSATPHEFSPHTRQVTLNPSVTSVDQVDFTDRSTIAVSGFVRYRNTDCFAKKVEILVNGASYSPAIYTDSTGKFTVDLEPGATVTLSPKYENHLFTPSSWDVVNLSSPIAGIVFNDITTRKITGRVAGGDCFASIIGVPQDPQHPNGTVCRVRARTLDGCFEQTIQISDADGFFSFTNMPPLPMTLAVVEHSNPVIKTAFQVQGGKQINLTKRDTNINLIYHSQPQIEITGFASDSACNNIVLHQDQTKTIQIRVKETYAGGQVCYLDTATVKIYNGFAESLKDTTLGNGVLTYTFKIGPPNTSPPFLKTLQVVATNVDGNETSIIYQAIVTGTKQKAPTFTTQLPEIPLMVLHDPPGDGSYAYIEKGETKCFGMTTGLVKENEDHQLIHVNVGPYVLLVGFEVETIIAADINFTQTFTQTTENSMEVCLTANERISTSGEDLIVGGKQGGDVFVGGGLNVIVGFGDRVTFNDSTCTVKLDTVVTVSPKSFPTTYIYSEYHIRNNIMRYLQAVINDIKNDPTKPDSDTLIYRLSLNLWENIFIKNELQKAKAGFRKNVSFDGGAEYESSETIEKSTERVVGEVHIDTDEFAVQLGAYLGGIGADVTIGTVITNESSKSTTSGSQYSTTVGYVLSDNDPGDAFSVDVAIDSVYKTPVFRMVAGQSSCPWEPGTAHREGTNLSFRDGSGPIVVDVPSNEAAVFKFSLGNSSETNETRTYAFSSSATSNPHGAKISLNGVPLDQGASVMIPYGTSVPVTVTVERGPQEYIYDSLEIALYSLCEDERANALGIPSDKDSIAYSSHYVSVHFIEPCSEVDINVPEQDWLVYPNPQTTGPDDILRITVSGYDKSQPQFDRIRMQYRRSNGDGTWINIVPPNDPNILAIQPGAEILKDSLGSVFTQFYWNTEGLADGPYEIRAIAVCNGNAGDQPGYSHVIKGRIERQPPSLIGTPEPADGVLQVGDEISFSFNKNVNCAKINAVDNVQLFDATTNQPIDIDITCHENKIILAPNFPNQYMENHILRAELHDIEDLIGNNLVYEQWEFYVDRNELAWLTDSIGMTKFEDQTKTITANIHNRGGYPAPFVIQDIPSWVHVVPNQGTLAPNEIRPIAFTVDSTLAFGLWSDSITLHTVTGQNPFFMGGNEGIPFGARVVCRPPNWDLNANLFENSMNVVAQLDIKGELSTDVEDMVVAFIGDTIVGRAHLQYVPQVNKYLVYLTIYGNPYMILSPIRLEIWDASACLRYSVQEDDFIFEPDAVFGNPLAPLTLHTTEFILREVPLGFGWNWLSFNLAFPEPDLDSALVSLNHPLNDLMKGQNAFSIYLNGAGWLGTLDTLGNKTMYIYRADQPDTLQMLGNLLNPATTPIPLVAGWNWIGYIPNYALPINEALSTVPAQTGDLIKSQVSFAQYINPTFGWIGNLKYMQPPNGYQLKIQTPGTLLYPPPPSNLTGGNDQGKNAGVALRPSYLLEAQQAARAVTERSMWSVDPTQFESSMTLIGMLKVDNANATTATMELGAFVGDQTRGTAQAIYIEPLQSYLFFLTVYANTGGEQVRYKLFDSSTGAIQPLTEVMYFSADLHQGSVDAPVPFTLTATGTAEAEAAQSFEVAPNPFHGETMFRFALPDAGPVRITITDVNGKAVNSISTQAREGVNTLAWKGQANDGTRLASGVYFVRLQTDKGSMVRKVILQ